MSVRLKPTLFQTSPLVRDPLRRRDPFGFADVATYYSDQLAPDLTNRQRDARWLSILCWSLRQVTASSPSLLDHHAIYNRLRGLELRWIIQACQAPNGKRKQQLPGKLAVQKLDKSSYRELRTKMGEAQWRRYRSNGPYAAYRGLMQYLGLLQSDGWTLSPKGVSLADAVSKKMPTMKAANIMSADDDNGWVSYWLRRWPLPDTSISARAFLPGAEKLLQGEYDIIVPQLFADGNRRRVVAECMQNSRASSHAQLCGDIQRKLLTDKNLAPSDRDKLLKLESFSHLADAAIKVLRRTYRISASHQSARPLLAHIAQEMGPESDDLDQACRAWTVDDVWPQIDHFVKRLKSHTRGEARIHCLLQLHEQLAGGLLWLKVRDGHIDRVARYQHPPGGYYRFRLNALADLALGCGVIHSWPVGLNIPQEVLNKDESNEADLNDD
jgi:hypothetical protein